MASIKIYRESRIDPLLGLSARVQGHVQFDIRLKEQLEQVTDWTELIELAGYHALAPLVAYHCQRLKVTLPKPVLFEFKHLLLHHKGRSYAQFSVLQEILSLYQAHEIEAIVLKGAAVAHQLYPTPAHRPMGDIDIWVDKQNVKRAYQLLAKVGFTNMPPAEPEDHKGYPLASRYYLKTAIHIELHFHLFGTDNDRGLDFTTAYKRGMKFTIGKVEAISLNPADQLWHLYRHAFITDIRFVEHFRLNRIADFVTAVECWLDTIDWPYVRHHYPEVWHILPLLHWITPWSERVIKTLQLQVDTPPHEVGELYVGYPSRYYHELTEDGLWSMLRKTVRPSSWWVQLHYGRPYWPSLGRHLLWIGRDLVQQALLRLPGKRKRVKKEMGSESHPSQSI